MTRCTSMPSAFMSRTLHVTGTQRTSAYIARTRTEQSSCPQHHTRETRATLDNHLLEPTAPINSLRILMFPYHRHPLHVRPHDTSFTLTHAFLHPHSLVVIQAFVFSSIVFQGLPTDILMKRPPGKVSSSIASHHRAGGVHSAMALGDLR